MSSILIRLSFIGFVTALSSRCVDPVIPQIAWGLQIDPAAVALLSTAFALPFALGAADPRSGRRHGRQNPGDDPVSRGAGDRVARLRACDQFHRLVRGARDCRHGDRRHFPGRSRADRRSRPDQGAPGRARPLADRDHDRQSARRIGRGRDQRSSGLARGVSGDRRRWLCWFCSWPDSPCAMRRASIGRAFNLRDIPAGYAGIFRNPRAKVCYSAVFIEGLAIFGLFPFVALLSARRRRSARIDRRPDPRRLFARRRDLCGDRVIAGRSLADRKPDARRRLAQRR